MKTQLSVTVWGCELTWNLCWSEWSL